ncbi:hypothetical protein VNO78_20572 [Psophocarpus tetragonolobus]|uniref:Uncharacterized protein n=1 Tax=Psophocarpus tetragonolobus TaxID=3891 RepID=A0AAN9SEU5_PSOTE
MQVLFVSPALSYLSLHELAGLRCASPYPTVLLRQHSFNGSKKINEEVSDWVNSVCIDVSLSKGCADGLPEVFEISANSRREKEMGHGEWSKEERHCISEDKSRIKSV